MIIETFNAIDDNGNHYRVSIDQEYTVIRDRSGYYIDRRITS